MKVKRLHPSASLRVNNWQFSPSQAIEMQQRLSAEVSRNGKVINPHFIAGVDISVRQGDEVAIGSAVVLSYPELEVVETRVARGRLNFPYIPGLLSFRELPLTLAVCEQLSITPDLILVDGQGIAHPRRIGIASHLGLFLDIPTIGCAKSLLCGSHETPGVEPGSYAEIRDNGETIGAALRTKLGVKPVYVSIGHQIDLLSSIHWVMKCCPPARPSIGRTSAGGLAGGGYRLPEPTRLAHQAVKGSWAIDIREAISAGTER